MIVNDGLSVAVIICDQDQVCRQILSSTDERLVVVGVAFVVFKVVTFASIVRQRFQFGRRLLTCAVVGMDLGVGLDGGLGSRRRGPIR